MKTRFAALLLTLVACHSVIAHEITSTTEDDKTPAFDITRAGAVTDGRATADAVDGQTAGRMMLKPPAGVVLVAARMAVQ